MSSSSPELKVSTDDEKVPEPTVRSVHSVEDVLSYRLYKRRFLGCFAMVRAHCWSCTLCSRTIAQIVLNIVVCITLLPVRRDIYIHRCVGWHQLVRFSNLARRD